MTHTYKFIPNHPIGNLHNYIAHFFEQLFLLEPANFDEGLLIHIDFVDMCHEYPADLLEKLKNIHRLYINLPNSRDKDLIKIAFKRNNQIEELCQNRVSPIRYGQLHENIRDEIYKFCTGLWDNVITKDKAKVKEKCGTVKEHFNAFTDKKHQFIPLCPCCGIQKMLSKNHEGKRNDYDHFIAKKHYPFNSINFHNLIPICDECNSKYKGQKDVLFQDKARNIRREVLYPYDDKISVSDVEVKINANTFLLEVDNRWSISISAKHLSAAQNQSWLEIFGLPQRYIGHIKDLENTWQSGIKRKFIKEVSKDNYSFESFQDDLMDDILDVNAQPFALIQKAYYQYFLSLPNVEEYLKNTSTFR